MQIFVLVCSFKGGKKLLYESSEYSILFNENIKKFKFYKFVIELEPERFILLSSSTLIFPEFLRDYLETLINGQKCEERRAVENGGKLTFTVFIFNS